MQPNKCWCVPKHQPHEQILCDQTHEVLKGKTEASTVSDWKSVFWTPNRPDDAADLSNVWHSTPGTERRTSNTYSREGDQTPAGRWATGADSWFLAATPVRFMKPTKLNEPLRSKQTSEIRIHPLVHLRELLSNNSEVFPQFWQIKPSLWNKNTSLWQQINVKRKQTNNSSWNWILTNQNLHINGKKVLYLVCGSFRWNVFPASSLFSSELLNRRTGGDQQQMKTVWVQINESERTQNPNETFLVPL